MLSWMWLFHLIHDMSLIAQFLKYGLIHLKCFNCLSYSSKFTVNGILHRTFSATSRDPFSRWRAEELRSFSLLREQDLLPLKYDNREFEATCVKTGSTLDPIRVSSGTKSLGFHGTDLHGERSHFTVFILV